MAQKIELRYKNKTKIDSILKFQLACKFKIFAYTYVPFLILNALATITSGQN